jgi:peptidoglycan/xylan/chitin deacetylase (PgdA/CDA1 family)
MNPVTFWCLFAVFAIYLIGAVVIFIGGNIERSRDLRRSRRQ